MNRQRLQLFTTEWFNVEDPLDVAGLRGKVVVLEAFQMLCPGCVAHGLPLAERIHQAFDRADLAVIGLHSVFEHHDAQGTREALAAFLQEYRFSFPIAIDEPSGQGRVPRTMATFQMRGTPSLLMFDKQGHLRQHYFGAVSELSLGAELASLIAEAGQQSPMSHAESRTDDGCSKLGCAIQDTTNERRLT